MSTITRGQRSIEMKIIRGEILSIDEKSELHVRGGGGGSYVPVESSTPVIRPIHISSSTTHTREVWVKREDGVEMPIMLNDQEIKLREGNQLSIVVAADQRKMAMAYVHNHNTQRGYSLATAREIADRFSLSHNPSGWYIIGALALGAVAVFISFLIMALFLPFMLSSDAVAILVLVAAFIMGVIPLFKKYGAVYDTHEKCISEVSQALKAVTGEAAEPVSAPVTV
ncbi:hypothetical protein HZS79_03125 [Halomonas zhaodongensis]|uniref:Uncharacterized protein n=2 Tax=Vreelandella zhaodongensis TaxID=1176240 RepID=A0ABX2SRA1_VREZH|nr:hypothetical protein [Halomonas zhaodongensis]NYS43933.1 hypothetical protein [Halomonas zhaodongensis]